MTITDMITLLEIYNAMVIDADNVSSVGKLHNLGLIESDNLSKYNVPIQVTDKGLALIDEWLNTPMPVAVWRVER